MSASSSGAPPVAIQLVRSGSSVALVGPAGIGKSWTIRATIEALERDGIEVLVASASESARRFPLAALAPVVELGTLGSEADRIRHALSWLRRSPSTVIVVDDAHLLDDASATLIHALIIASDVRVVVAVRSGEPMPDAIAKAIDSVNVSVLIVGALSREESTGIIEDHLGGVVGAQTLGWLLDAGEGSPLQLRQVLDDTLRIGIVARTANRVWEASGPIASPSLRERFRAMLADLDPGERELAELLAVTNGVPLPLLDRLCDAAIVRRATAARWAIERRGHLELHHSLLVDATRATITTADAAQRLQSALDAVRQEELTEPRYVLTYTTWIDALGDARADADQALLFAAQRLMRAAQPMLALPLLERAFAIRQTPETELALRGCRSYFGRADEQDDPAATLESLRWMIRGHIISAHTVGLEEAFARAADQVTDPAAVAEVQMYAISLEAMSSDACEPGLSWLESFVRSWPTHPATAEAFQVLGSLLVEAGRANEVEEVWAPTADPNNPHHVSFSAFLRSDAARREGDLERADSILADLAAQPFAADFLPAGLLQSARGRRALQLGRPREAARHFAAFVDMLATFDPTGDASVGRAELALSIAWSGDAAASVPPRPVLDGLSRWRRSVIELRRVQTMSVLGDHVGARHDALLLADRAATDGRFAVALDAAHLALRLDPSNEVLTLIEQLAARCTDRLAPLVLRHARASEARDAAELHAVAALFDMASMPVLAIEADLAARRHMRTRRRGGAGSIAERLVAAGARPLVRDLVVEPAQGALVGRGLTESEQMVVLMASRGVSNRAIGEALGISVRTAETHLQRAYRKLGVAGRDALAALLAD